MNAPYLCHVVLRMPRDWQNVPLNFGFELFVDQVTSGIVASLQFSADLSTTPWLQQDVPNQRLRSLAIPWSTQAGTVPVGYASVWPLAAGWTAPSSHGVCACFRVCPDCMAYQWVFR